MANDSFRFKQFTVRHDKCAMKVGTDGVLLGAWAGKGAYRRLLDVGTGSGLIALMLAQRFPEACIRAIDIDKEACRQAIENVNLSSFSERIKVYRQSLHSCTKYEKQKYNLIVSNPPYFVDALKCPDSRRTTARHADTLTLESLLHDSKKMLAPDGRIALILPYDQKKRLYTTGETEGLFIVRETEVVPIPGADPKRLLAELANTPSSEIEHSRLVIEMERHRYSEAYIRLTRDFYLNM